MTDNKQSPRKLSRRDLIRGGLATAAAASFLPLLAACQPVPAQTSAPAASESAGPEDIEMLAYWWSDSPRDAKVLIDTFTAFAERHPGVKITFDDTGSGHLDEADDKHGRGDAAGHLCGSRRLDGTGRRGRAVGRLDALRRGRRHEPISTTTSRRSWASTQYEGGLYALPYYSGPSCTWYNEDIFREKGLKTPWEHEQEGTWTWETLRELARQTTGGEGMERTLGWDAAQNPHNLHYYLCVPMVDQWRRVHQRRRDRVAVRHRKSSSKSSSGIRIWRSRTNRWSCRPTSRALPACSTPGDWRWHGASRPTRFPFPATTSLSATPRPPRVRLGASTVTARMASARPARASTRIWPSSSVSLWVAKKEPHTYLASGRSFPVRQSLKDSKYFFDALRPFERAEVHLEAAADSAQLAEPRSGGGMAAGLQGGDRRGAAWADNA